MTTRRPCPPAPGPLEDYAQQFDSLWSSLAQRRGFRDYLQGLLLPRDRNKTLTGLAGRCPELPANRVEIGLRAVSINGRFQAPHHVEAERIEPRGRIERRSQPDVCSQRDPEIDGERRHQPREPLGPDADDRERLIVERYRPADDVR